MTVKVVIGIVVIAASFIYILKRPDKSMMDRLMEKRNRQMEEALQQSAEAKKADDSQQAESEK